MSAVIKLWKIHCRSRRPGKCRSGSCFPRKPPNIFQASVYHTSSSRHVTVFWFDFRSCRSTFSPTTLFFPYNSSTKRRLETGLFKSIYQFNPVAVAGDAAPSCDANPNCSTNILLKSTLMMTKLRDSAVFVPPSCAPLSETLELSNKQDRRGASPSPELRSLRVILHAGPVWLCACGSRCGGRTAEGPSPSSRPAALRLHCRLHCCPLANDWAVGS